MTRACVEIRDLLLERGGAPLPGDADLSAHLDVCGECAGFARRATRIARILSGLPRHPAPRELDGLAVGLLQAGHRQDRAVAALRSLPRLHAPRELAELALDRNPTLARAPSVLDRLVEEDLRSHAAALTRRFAETRDARGAPRALRERLERSARALLRPSAARRALLAAAGLAVVLSGGGLWLLRTGRGARDLDLEVRYESSLEAMDPMARSLLGGLSGGLVDVPGNER